MKCVIICVFIWIRFGVLTSFAQIKSLDIGDSVPVFSVTNVIGYSSNYVDLSKLKDKFIILDFGSLYCRECFTSYLRFDTLQKIFNEKVQFFWVVPNSIDEVNSFLKKNRDRWSMEIPIIAGDTILNQYFKHVFTPHEVWIDNLGIIKAFTDQGAVDSFRIREILSKKDINWTMKYEYSYDCKKDILTLNDDITSSSVPSKLFSTVFTSYLNGIRAGFFEKINDTSGMLSIHLINRTVLDLYTSIFRIIDSTYEFYPSRLILHMKDSSRILYNPRRDYLLDWQKKYAYCYEANLPGNNNKRISGQKLLSDLDYFLNMKGRLENRKVLCWVIVKKQSLGEGGSIMSNRDSLIHVANNINDNYSLSGLVYWLNQITGGPPVINGTSWSAKQNNLHLFKWRDKNPFSLSGLRKVLAAYNLYVIATYRTEKMLILSDY